MAIAESVVAAYAPWGNAQLSFKLAGGLAAIDPATGNATQTPETVEYLAALKLDAPNWSGQPGADNTAYRCSGRLLSPATLDKRITNGAQAEAVIEGLRGRFELQYVVMDPAFKRDLRQLIQGTFRVIGGVA